MALIEKINNLRNQGANDNQIITSLREEGFSPRDINDAISQANIKSAIGGPNSTYSQETNSELQPSIMAAQDNSEQTVGSSEYSQNPQQQTPYNPEQQYAAQEQYTPEQYAQAQAGYDQTQYSPEQYAQTQQNYYQQGADIETIRDVAKQETEEALKKIKEQMNTLEKMKTEMNFEMQDISNRLTRVESVINDLQSAIIRKMGEYGQAISGISQEVRATQNSFAKIINPVMDQKRGIPQQNAQQQTQAPAKQSAAKAPQQSARAEKSASFEDYFR